MESKCNESSGFPAKYTVMHAGFSIEGDSQMFDGQDKILLWGKLLNLG